MNIKFNNEANRARRENENRGRPNLGVTIHSRGRLRVPPRDGEWTFRDRLYWKQTGRVYQVRNPWKTIGRIRIGTRYLVHWNDFRCLIGLHCRTCDFMNLDGSVDCGACIHCDKERKPHNPLPPDAARAAEWTKSNEESKEYNDALDAMLDGTGPCPDCGGSTDNHTADCWNSPEYWNE